MRVSPDTLTPAISWRHDLCPVCEQMHPSEMVYADRKPDGVTHIRAVAFRPCDHKPQEA